MERLLKEKDMYSNSFKRHFREVQIELKRDEPDMFTVQGTMKTLEGTFESLNEINKKIIDFVLDDDTLDVDVDSMKSEIDEVIKNFHTLQIKVDFQLRKDTADIQSISSLSSTSKRRLKLPKIEFKKFSGDLKEWLSFWNQYRRIHEDDQIEKEDKFQYLIQATIPKSRARQLIESYPATSKNYDKVIESLKSRFGRKDLLVEMYVRELLKLVLSSLNNKTKLSVLYDKMETQLRALETLNVTTDTCAAILYPLVESCLPEDLLRVWQRSESFSSEDTFKTKLENMMKFLKREVENEERFLLATSSFDFSKSKKVEDSKENTIPTASGLMNQNKHRCIFCKKEHANDQCDEAVRIAFSERKKISSSKGCCHVCLKFGHIARKCRSAAKLECSKCKGKHVTLMCPDENKNVAQNSTVENLSNQTYNHVFLQTIAVILHGKNNFSRKVRALIDTGSQRSYILKQTALDIGYEVLKTEDLIHGLFGGFQSDPVTHSCFKAMLQNLHNNYTCTFDVLDQEVICSNVSFICNGPWMSELKNLDIDVSDTCDGPIEILIGADVTGKLLTGRRHILASGLIALETKLGWTLMGKTPTNENCCSSLIVTSLHCKETTVAHLWELDILGITDPAIEKSRKEIEEAVLQHFLENITRLNDGRYEVSLPWLSDHPPLPSNFCLAKKRVENLKKRLQREGYYQDYCQVFKEWLDEKIIEEVPVDEYNLDAHYLPHRHVVKLSSATTKIRPVFDASAKISSSSPSLNDCLERGINLIELIPSMLIRFRLRKIGVVADIRKAFLQISLNIFDRNYLRFLWYNDLDEIVFYRHARVMFGATCSPFLLGAVIDFHLKKALENSKYSLLILNQLINSFYVDNCITSLDDEDSLQNYIRESTEVMAEGQFDLRLWEYTFEAHSEKDIVHLSPVLGLNWNKQKDTLQLNLNRVEIKSSDKITKKTILSVASRIFDPIGFACPFLVCPKILLQKICLQNLNWNSEVPDYISQEFQKWLEDVQALNELNIPRWLAQEMIIDIDETSIHLFCDASQKAYAAAIFIRTVSAGGIHLNLLQAKSRVSPIKKISICRLELMAATIGTRLLNAVKKELKDIKNISLYCWTDSTTVLSWIKRSENWRPFVKNRVQEIRSLTDKERWYYVPGELNPADLPSRGCSATKLVQSKWWEGPIWLQKPITDWPTQIYPVNEEVISSEKITSIVGLLSHNKIDVSWIYCYFSKYKKMIRMVGWIYRFIFNCKNPKKKINGELSVEETEYAENSVIRLVQQETFDGMNDKQFGTLVLYKDKEYILRLRTKISEREDLENFRFPVLLPARHPVVRRLILDRHIDLCHAGVQTLLSALRENYWIIGGRKTIRSIISKCIPCNRIRGKSMESCPVALPRDRVKDAAVFEVTGVDMAGPLFLRDKTKVWICLFTCAIYRAVHLELVTSLSTDSFLQALRRFISRRGRPSILYCDNGTNFVGADNLFGMIDWDCIQNFSSVERIRIKLNPPTAPWWGGWWERLVGMLKDLLKKVLGKASLRYEELLTLICDCEAVINSRPITYISESNSDLISLTPAMFLQDIREIGVPDLDAAEATDLKRRFRYRIKLREILRSRFRKEYLGCLNLQRRKFSKQKIKEGDIVIVGSDNSKRIDWPLGKIVELIPGKDGQIRLVRLKTEKGSLLRPLQRIFPLEAYDGEEKDFLKPDLAKDICKNQEIELTQSQDFDNNGENRLQNEKSVITRSGRQVKRPDRLGY